MKISSGSCLEDDFELALEAFNETNLDAILRDASDLGYTSIAQALFKAAREAENRGNQALAQVLMLLDRSCWTPIPHSKSNNPFYDSGVSRKKRTDLESAFSDSEICFLENIVNLVNNPYLRGKLADLVWNRQQKRDIQFALLAIDSYIGLPLDPDTWFGDGQECWLRAIDLSLSVGQAARDRIEHIESSLLCALDSATTERGFFGYLLAEAIMFAGLARSHATTVATKLESLACQFDADNNFQAARRHCSAAANWYDFSGDIEKSVEMTVSEAEILEKDAIEKIDSDDPSHRVAISFLEDAVQVYRSIRTDRRDRHQVDKKVQDLRSRISEYNPLAMDELARISLPGVDVSKIAAHARSSVAGKPLLDALKAFADLHRTDYSTLREMALESLKEHTLLALFPKSYLSDDGRVVSKIPGISGSNPSNQDESVVRATMNEFHYRYTISIAVLGKILPALGTLNSEHDLNDSYFVELARQSPIVPKGRETLFGKSLALGFKQDFAPAIYLLTPQIENMVRAILKSANVVTTHLDKNGIETENGLGTLMRLEETETILGENLTYEIEALFCDPVGPNLRNYIAHGLLDDQHSNSYESVYAWWLGFKLVFNTYWPLFHQGTLGEEQPQDHETFPD